jgi:hypothetical protein
LIPLCNYLQKGKKMIEPLQHKQRQSAILLVEHALQFVATVVMMGGGGQ